MEHIHKPSRWVLLYQMECTPWPKLVGLYWLYQMFVTSLWDRTVAGQEKLAINWVHHGPPSINFLAQKSSVVRNFDTCGSGQITHDFREVLDPTYQWPRKGCLCFFTMQNSGLLRNSVVTSLASDSSSCEGTGQTCEATSKVDWEQLEKKQGAPKGWVVKESLPLAVGGVHFQGDVDCVHSIKSTAKQSPTQRKWLTEHCSTFSPWIHTPNY